ncbi:MAG: hypothetical protein ACM359_02975 [Bacillota bacterium]
MFNVTQSAYTSPTTGKRLHTVLVCGCAYAAPREDEQGISEIARAAFDSHAGHARLIRWDGDTQRETVVAEK